MKYVEVIKYIQHYIRENHLASGAKLPTEKAFAEQLHVSRITMQRAYQELIEQGIIRRVQGSGTYYIGDGYLSKAENTVQYIPMVLADDQESRHAIEMIQGADQCLACHSCYLSVHFSHMNPQRERQIIQQLVDDGAHCLIVFPCTAAENCAFYFQLIRQGIRLIFIDRLPKNITADLVTCDNFQGGYIAAKHLLQTGRKRLGLVSVKPISEALSLSQRLEGFHFALDEQSVPFFGDFICFTDKEQLSVKLMKMMSKPMAPDGLFCVNDITAIEVMKCFERNHIRVPEQVAVIGFDNWPITANLPTPLTEIEQSFFRLGFEAAEIVCQILTKKIEYFVQKTIPVTLIQRNSTEIKND